MAEDTDTPTFYSPWPSLGKGLGHQLNEIRQDTEILNVLARSLVFDNNVDPIKESVLLGTEYGNLSQHNRFRAVYDEGSDQWVVQVNTGTEASPIWVTSISVDSNGFNSFYPKGITVVEGSNTFSNKQVLSFFTDHFYLTSDSNGNPVVNSRVGGGGGGSGTITGGTALGGDEDIFAGEVANALTFKGLTAGKNISLTSDANQITTSVIDNPAFKNAAVTGNSM